MSGQTTTLSNVSTQPTSGKPQPELSLTERYDEVRRCTEALCEPLEVEDYIIQSMQDCSPTKWHLAHTTWFFEVFVLQEAVPGYKCHRSDFRHLFNSYYNTFGTAFARQERGVLSRPSVKEVFAYRHHVDEQMRSLLASTKEPALQEWSSVVEVGLNHEQQHQELILSDIKHAFSRNPLYPSYRASPEHAASSVEPIRWLDFAGGLCEVGAAGDSFSYDNERPRHQAYLHPFQLADRLITNGEYLAFMEDNGYSTPQLWLSDGLDAVQQQRWDAPLYWQEIDNQWWQFSLAGLRPVIPSEPVCHVSFFEAEAFARWMDAYLPYEFAWEIAAKGRAREGNLAEQGLFRPVSAPCATDRAMLRQMFGDTWEWTLSPYAPYPRFRPPGGALGEYNGKFMCNQMVLRGGSCATPVSHIRATYRNFLAPQARWQFSGIRLAK